MIGSFVFLNPPSKTRRNKSGGTKMAYRRRKRNGTKKGQIRRTSRRAYTGLKRRRRSNGTTAGEIRKTSRRAYKGLKPRRRRRKNPLWRTRKTGQYSGTSGTRSSRKKRLTKASPRGWRNNPRRAVRYSNNPMKQMQKAFEEVFSMDTFEQVVHTGVGFAGAIAGTNVLVDNIGVDALKSGWGKVGATAGVSAIESGLAHMITKDARLSKRILVGGMLATVLRALGQVIPADSEMRKWVPTLGNANSQFRRSIERQVLRELRGSGNSAYYLPSVGSSAYGMPAAGSSAYLTPKELRKAENRAGLAGMGAYLTAREGEEIDTFGVAGYSGPVNEFGNAGGPRERF